MAPKKQIGSKPAPSPTTRGSLDAFIRDGQITSFMGVKTTPSKRFAGYDSDKENAISLLTEDEVEEVPVVRRSSGIKRSKKASTSVTLPSSSEDEDPVVVRVRKPARRPGKKTVTANNDDDVDPEATSQKSSSTKTQTKTQSEDSDSASIQPNDENGRLTEEARKGYIVAAHEVKLSQSELLQLEPPELVCDDLDQGVSNLAPDSDTFSVSLTQSTSGSPATVFDHGHEERERIIEDVVLSHLPTALWATVSEWVVGLEPPSRSLSKAMSVPAAPQRKTDWMINDALLDVAWRDMVEKFRSAAPDLDAAHLVAPSGSLNDMLMVQLHCPNFNCHPSNYSYGSVSDVSNRSLAFLNKAINGLDGALVFDFRPLRIDHNGKGRKAPWLHLPASVIQIFDDFVVQLYNLSESKANLVLGSFSNANYLKRFPQAQPVSLDIPPLFGENTHLYIESFGSDSPRQGIRRLSFVNYHPSAFGYGIAKQTSVLLSNIFEVASALAFRTARHNFVLRDNDELIAHCKRQHQNDPLRIITHACSLGTKELVTSASKKDCPTFQAATMLRIAENREGRLLAHSSIPQHLLDFLDTAPPINNSVLEIQVRQTHAMARASTTILETQLPLSKAPFSLSSSSGVPLTDQSSSDDLQSSLALTIIKTWLSNPENTKPRFGPLEGINEELVYARLAGCAQIWHNAARNNGILRSGRALRDEEERIKQKVEKDRAKIRKAHYDALGLSLRNVQEETIYHLLWAWAAEVDKCLIRKDGRPWVQLPNGMLASSVHRYYQHKTRQGSSVSSNIAFHQKDRDLFTSDKDKWLRAMVERVLPDKIAEIPPRWQHLHPSYRSQFSAPPLLESP